MDQQCPKCGSSSVLWNQSADGKFCTNRNCGWSAKVKNGELQFLRLMEEHYTSAIEDTHPRRYSEVIYDLQAAIRRKLVAIAEGDPKWVEWKQLHAQLNPKTAQELVPELATRAPSR
ncbi:hypothetical protein A2V71_04485 [Candidatus Berkelbacteria bacterium RBG_13_40_8]|uniref:Uncharacterized protein n=1 Tax=Candidatus Berkelbacteria bacterium RBG_13_40_8 TaxID=1797467 RepID=A0A1F5DMM4_9BACT|nr:MAG: hypothetical protein A2V71_04485 [Candidatus Berkelbacteria bacterium RBG_13_40_8]